MDEENNNESQNVITLFPLICIALLLIGLFKLQYGYYTFLRIIICLWGILYGITKYNLSKGNIVSLLCFGIAILYNPIITIHLEKSAWFVINICTAGLIAICSVNMAALQCKIREKFKIAPIFGLCKSLIGLIIVTIKRNKIETFIICAVAFFIFAAIYEATMPVKPKDTTLDYLKPKSSQTEIAPGLDEFLREESNKFRNKNINTIPPQKKQTLLPLIDSRTDINNQSLTPTQNWHWMNSDAPLAPKRVRLNTEGLPIGY